MGNYKLRSTKQTVSLGTKEYVAEGGEGQIFTKGGMAYKVCFPGKMMPEGKIAELAVLDKDFILRPLDVLLDAKGKPVGYAMNFVPQDQCYCLPTTFTNTFKNREHLTDDKVLNLIKFMREGIDFVHSQSILLVDLNEFNFLVSKDFQTVYFIDVNSYQTKRYPTTAIMESIRDRHSKGFSDLTDWFSFAIVSFEMLIGIHPFRGGNHPVYEHLAIDERMDARMKANVSVLNPKTRFPKNGVRPFTVIPTSYLEWYNAVFEQGKRTPPPLDFVARAVLLTPIKTVVSDSINIAEAFETLDAIKKAIFINGQRLLVTTRHVYIGDKGQQSKVPDTNIFHDNGEFFSVTVEGNRIALYSMSRQLRVSLLNEMEAQQVTVIDNRVYCQSGDKIVELMFANARVHGHMVAGAMEHATSFGDGFITQNVAGSCYFILLPETRRSLQVRLKELDGLKIISGKMLGSYATIFTKDKANKIQKHKIVFSDDTYSISSEATDLYDYQMILLDNGLLIETDADGNLLATRGRSCKKIISKFLTGEDYILTSSGSAVKIAKGNKLFDISTK